MEKMIRKIEAKPILASRKKVAAYTRVSCGKDTMMHSLAAQVSYYSSMIQSNGEWEYAGVYVDSAFTGTKENRPDFQRMLSDCRAGKINMILVKSISRLARNTVTQLETIRELKSMGIDIYFENEQIHTMTAEGELLITLLASFAQEESRSASENQKWKIRHAFERGELQCMGTMFGYTIEGGTLRVNDAEAEIVCEVFRRVIAGESMRQIGIDLNQRRIPRPFGGKWNFRCVSDLLTNEKYTGNALLQKTFVNNHLDKRQVVNNGEVARYYATETHPAIVTQEEFELVQKRLQAISEKNRDRAHQVKCEFTGLIHCPHCGANYRHITNNGSTGWRCRTYQEMGAAFCHSKNIPDDTLRECAAAAMGLDVYSADSFIQLIDHIEVPEDNLLEFIFRDGHVVQQRWTDKSRRDSWTPEMRERARQHAKRRRKS